MHDFIIRTKRYNLPLFSRIICILTAIHTCILIFTTQPSLIFDFKSIICPFISLCPPSPAPGNPSWPWCTGHCGGRAPGSSCLDIKARLLQIIHITAAQTSPWATTRFCEVFKPLLFSSVCRLIAGCWRHQVTSRWAKEGRCWSCTANRRPSAWTAWWVTPWGRLSHSTTVWSPGGSTATSAWRTCWPGWGGLWSWTARWESGSFVSMFYLVRAAFCLCSVQL